MLLMYIHIYIFFKPIVRNNERINENTFDGLTALIVRNTRRTMAILKRSVLSWLTDEIKRVADGATFHRIPFMNNTKHETVISLLSFRDRRL